MTAFNAVRGGIQSGQSKKMMGEMWKEDAKIPLYDPMQQSMLGRLQRQERQMRMGTDPSTALAMRNIGQVAAQTQANLARAGGPGLVQNLLSSQRTAGSRFAEAGANAAAAANQLINPQLGLIGDMARRAYDRQRYRRNVLFAQAQQKKADASASMEAAMGSLAMIPSFMGAPGLSKEMASVAKQAPTAMDVIAAPSVSSPMQAPDLRTPASVPMPTLGPPRP